MTSPDFDELARLWTQEQSPEEERAFQLLARRVGRRARLWQVAEIAAGLVLILAVAAAMLTAADRSTLAVGALVVVAILWAGWKRRLNAVAMLVDTAGCAAMLDSAVRNGRASLRRSRLGLMLLAPGYLLGALLKYSLQNDGVDGFLSAFAASLRGFWPGWAGLSLLAAILAYLARSHLRMRREVARLEMMRDQYRAESALDAEDA